MIDPFAWRQIFDRAGPDKAGRLRADRTLILAEIALPKKRSGVDGQQSALDH
jgi:hypothetical protein